MVFCDSHFPFLEKLRISRFVHFGIFWFLLLSWMKYSNFSAELRIAKNFVNFYNAQLATFEPLLEPWALQATYEQHEKITKISISTPELINVNFTLPFLETIYDILEFQTSLEEYFRSQHGKGVKKKSRELTRLGIDQPQKTPKVDEKQKFNRSQITFHPYVLRNMTGRTLELWRETVSGH